jgi:hypothetical protein
MSPFWNGFFEHLRSCGRNGGIFFLALACFLALSILVRAFHNDKLIEISGPALAGVALILLIRVGAAIWRGRSGGERLRFPRLSDDELRVARTRLKNQGGKN